MQVVELSGNLKLNQIVAVIVKLIVKLKNPATIRGGLRKVL